MRRFRKLLLYIVGVVLLLPVLAVAALMLALNLDPGRRFAESQIAALTGNTVRLQGLSGRFPDRLRLAHVEVSDSQGPYVTADDVALDWSPLALLQKQVLVHRLEAARFSFARLPVADPNAPAPAKPASSEPFTLPVRVTVERLVVPAAAIGAPLLGGSPATLALDASADLPTLETGTARVAAHRLVADGTVSGSYALDAAITGERIDAQLHVQEPEAGLIATLAQLPAIGPLSIDAAANGPRNALATTLALAAGPLTANATANVDTVGNRLTADITAKAPAMRPADGVSWQSIDLQTHVAGPFTAPDASGHLAVADLAAQGATLHALTADLDGNAGQVSVRARAEQLRIPGPKPDLLAAAPLLVEAGARLDDPSRPVRYKLSHPLIALEGTARTAGALAADAVLTLPDLGPLAAVAALDLTGRTTLNLHADQARTGTPEGVTALHADGTLALTGGPAPVPALLGNDARIAIDATTAGSTVTLTRASVAGAAVTLDAHGQTTPAGLDATARLALSNLSLLTPTVTGAATLDAHAVGPLEALALDATIAGDVGAPGIERAPIKLAANFTGLPAKPTGRITGSGTLAGAPLDLALDATRDAAGTLHASIGKADWRSLHADGDLTLPAGATIPTGTVNLRMPTLADLRPLIGQKLSGGVVASLAIDPATATLDAELRNAGLPGTEVGHATVKARVADPLANPSVNATLVADGIDAAGTTGNARIEVNGPQTALAIRANANLVSAGTAAQIAGTALLDAAEKQVRLDTLQVDAKPPGYGAAEIVRLTAPATVRFADGVAVDRLRLALRSATLDVAGKLSPTLDATVAVRANVGDLPLPQADGPAVPQYDGSITVDAKLAGTPAAPAGTVKLSAADLRARGGAARAIPPANLNATANLGGDKTARIEARLVAGAANLALNGVAPLGAGPLNLRANGGLDLAMLDPILAADGRRLRGRLTLDSTIGGTVEAPQIAGGAQLAGGEFEDYGQGIHVDRLAATIRADGQTVRIASFTGRAGPGTIGASGTVGVLAPGLPVDLTITARNARPLASDTLSADIDADLTVKGPAASLAAGGKIRIRRADLSIPSSLPASVAVLKVSRPGDKPPPPPGPPTSIALDLTIDAPGQIFIRGRGVDAEMAGNLRIRGTSTQPQVGGGLNMRRGTVSVAGTTLNFSRGKVGFDGTGVNGKIDPTLDLSADSTAGGVTATLNIGGYVSKPKISLTSVPDLPQDEVLAYLIFKRSAKELGPFQIAQIAAGLAELSGVTGSGGGPLDTIRKGLGLDRLGIGSSSNTAASSSSSSSSTANAPTVEAGRYVANGVYVGAKQGATGGQTGATVQIDITKGLKLQTDVGTGQGGNQVGVTYQFEY